MNKRSVKEIWCHGLLTNRLSVIYEKAFGFDLKDWKNLDVLEIGPGQDESFARAALHNHVRSMTVLNPALMGKEHVDHVLNLDEREKMNTQERSSSRVMRVAGDVNFFPFAPASFDRIVALWSVPKYLHDNAEVLKMYRNCIHALRKGGVAYFSPVTSYFESVDDDEGVAEVYRVLNAEAANDYRLIFSPDGSIAGRQVLKIVKL